MTRPPRHDAPRLARWFVLPVLASTLALLVAGCTIGSPSDQPAAASAQATTSTPMPPATATVVPADKAVDVNPLAPVSLAVHDGTVDTIAMTNDAGEIVPGVVTPDKLSWKPAVTLGYGRTYTVAYTLAGGDGTKTPRTSTFTTLTPGNQTAVSFVTTGGNLLTDGGTFGVGIVLVAHFDEEIADKAAAERAMTVQTTPAVLGSWYWADDQNAHWRPENYYAPGTRVTVNANIYGKQLGTTKSGAGLFGQSDATTSFNVGDAHISVADDNTKQVVVTDNGQVVRTMNTSMGRGGTETINGTTLSFWTQPGTYTVLSKANPVIMDSSTYGLPVNSRLGYKESISYATRISNDGIYLHQLDSTVWAQGNTDTSHGCLNLNGSDAKWFFGFSQTGDVVEIKNTGGAPLELWQNGDWSVPWKTWKAGSALT